MSSTTPYLLMLSVLLGVVLLLVIFLVPNTRGPAHPHARTERAEPPHAPGPQDAAQDARDEGPGGPTANTQASSQNASLEASRPIPLDNLVPDARWEMP